MQGLVASARGDHGECLRKFKRAFELLAEKRAKFRRDETVYVLYAEFLRDMARRFAAAGNAAHAEKLEAEAGRCAAEYLTRQPKGPWAARATAAAEPVAQA